MNVSDKITLALEFDADFELGSEGYGKYMPVMHAPLPYVPYGPLYLCIAVLGSEGYGQLWANDGGTGHDYMMVLDTTT